MVIDQKEITCYAVKQENNMQVIHPLNPEELKWHPETRLAVGDIDGDGKLNIVITESEIGNARIAILRQEQLGKAWNAEII